MQNFFKFSVLVCIIGCITTLAVIAENNDSVGGVDDTTAAIDNATEDNTGKTSWLRKATGKVKDAVKLEERKQKIKNKGEQMLDEQAPKVVEQAKQKAKAQKEAHQPQNEPTSGWFRWFLLYAWYAFCSPYAFGVYLAIILFTFFWQHVLGRGKYRVFSGSRVYCFILCLSIILGLVVTLNTGWQGAVWEQIWKNDTFILLLPNSIALLICYFRVSMVHEERYEEREDHFGREVSNEFWHSAHESRGVDWSGDWTEIVSRFFGLIFFLTIGILFAPVLVCINLLLNYVFARSTLPLEKVKQNE